MRLHQLRKDLAEGEQNSISKFLNNSQKYGCFFNIEMCVCVCRLTQDVIYYEVSPSLVLSDAQTLDLPNSGVRSVDLSPVDLLQNLARYRYTPSPPSHPHTLTPSHSYSLNLEQNGLTSLSGLTQLNQLKVNLLSLFLSLKHTHTNTCDFFRSCPSLQRCCWKIMLLSLHPNIIVHVENVLLPLH